MKGKDKNTNSNNRTLPLSLMRGPEEAFEKAFKTGRKTSKFPFVLLKLTQHECEQLRLEKARSRELEEERVPGSLGSSGTSRALPTPLLRLEPATSAIYEHTRTIFLRASWYSCKLFEGSN